MDFSPSVKNKVWLIKLGTVKQKTIHISSPVTTIDYLSESNRPRPVFCLNFIWYLIKVILHTIVRNITWPLFVLWPLYLKSSFVYQKGKNCSTSFFLNIFCHWLILQLYSRPMGEQILQKCRPKITNTAKRHPF